MVRLRALAPAFILMAALLAGCLGGGDEDPGGEGGSGGSKPAPDAGTVSGQVLDVDLNYIEGANARLVGADGNVNASANTDAQGEYRITNVLPGSYRVQISAICCHEDVQTVIVGPNEDVTHNVRLVPFSDIELQTPYGAYDQHVGFMACQFTLPNNQSYGCGVVPDNRPTHTFVAREGLRTLVVALDWDVSGVTPSEQLEFVVINLRNDYVLAYEVGPPPLVARIDNSDISDEDKRFDNFDDDGVAVQLRARPSVGSFVYQQPLRFYWYVHYFEEGPEDVRVLPDS